MVFASSSMVYGDFVCEPAVEDQQKLPKDLYGGAKYAAEILIGAYARRYSMDFTIIRPSALYGPTDVNHRVSQIFLEKAIAQEEIVIHGSGETKLDFTFVDDVVEANLRAAKAKNVSGEVFNVANGRTYSMLDIVSELEEILDRPLARKFFPRRAGDVRKTWADPSRARARMGYRCTHTFEEGILKTWQYFMRRRPSV